MRKLSIVGLAAAMIASVVTAVQTQVVAGIGAPGVQQSVPDRGSLLASAAGREVAERAERQWQAARRNHRSALAEQAAAGQPWIAPLLGSAPVTQGKTGNGDYTATPLAPSASWSAGDGSGSFSWSFPLRMPPAAAGPGPKLEITYNSASVDGRTFTTNNQPSVLGEGFDITSSYIERTYISCSQDGHSSSYDLCWRHERLRLVLNGKASEMVPVGADEFRLRSDDGTVVRRLDGATNGDNDGEHWRVTTNNGTTYDFGLNRLPGWTAGAEETNSVWTVPVYSDDTGDPARADVCKKATFGDSWCHQAWRWNVDLVTDTKGNAATYWYTEETNFYARAGKESAPTKYTRGGFLRRIDYGLRKAALFTNGAPTPAPQRATFAHAERCLAADCGSLTKESKYKWPDVPFDSICDAGDTCTLDWSPTFFTRKLLTGVTTSIATASGRRDVDGWVFDHQFIDPGDVGDTSDQVLWLSSITHTGLAGAAPIKHRPVRLLPTLDQAMRNRVDTASDGIAPLIRPRLSQVISETGAVIDVTYSAPDCTAANLPTPTTNTRRCFPVYWAPYGGDPTRDWFHKYVVTNVRQTDTTTGDAINTSYIYGDDNGVSDDAAWHYDEDPLRADAYRTWSEWRGYDRVMTLVGISSAPERSATLTTYFRGMNGDRNGSGGTRTVSIPGIHGPAVTDHEQFAGLPRETVVYNGRKSDGTYGAEVSGTVQLPWSRQTAAHTFPEGTLDGKTASAVTVRAHQVRPDLARNWTRVTSGATPYLRWATTDVAAFDAHGLPEQTDEYVNATDSAAASERTCTRTWYARTAGSPIVDLVSRSQVLARACADIAAAVLPTATAQTGDVISDTATVYDASTSWNAATLTDGNPTKSLRARYYSAGAPVWQTTATMSYDALGRPLDITNAGGAITKTRYNPAGAGVPISATITNHLGHAKSTTFDAAWMKPTLVVDANGKRTESTYDALGRLTAVWTPIANRALGSSPVHKYAYHVGGASNASGFVDSSWIATYRPKGNTQEYLVSYEIFDALLRSRQTQVPSPRGGRMLTDKHYDHRGLETQSFKDVWDNSAAPSGQRWVVEPGGAVQTDTRYDGANRPIATTTTWSTPTERQSRTVNTTYTGDSTAVEPPVGGSATREIVDALGRVVEKRVYSGNDADVATYTASKFGYDARRRLASVTSTADNTASTYVYDLFGRKTTSVDPDRGTTTMTYDDRDRLASTQDAMGRVLSYTYDDLDRKLVEWSGAVNTGTKLAEWAFDTLASGTPAAGQLVSATRWHGGKAYKRENVELDNLYRPTRTRLALPTTDELVTSAGLPAALDMTTAYNRDGTVQTTGEPAVAGLPAETVSLGYTDLGLPRTMAGASGIVLDTQYSEFGDRLQTTLGVSTANTNKVWLTANYDGLRRLTRYDSTETNGANHLLDLNYTYNDADRITSIADTSGAGADYQCFTYDGYQRLTAGWTPKTNNCALSYRTTANMDTGAESYWHEFSYKPSGLRDKVIKRAVTATGSTSTTTYTYGGTCGTTALGPHVLSKTTTVVGLTTTDTDAFCANKAGETTQAEAPGGTAQTFTWDAEGRMATLTQSGVGSLTNVYDANGDLLLRRPANGAAGATTVYVGATEVTVTKTVTNGVASFTTAGTRSYAHGGVVVAVRVGAPGATAKLHFVAGDHHGTSAARWDALNVAVRVKRYTDPFGSPRGADPAWVDDKRFLGKPHDKRTGVTHVGAREYSAELGRFLSVDPVLTAEDPQSLNGYVYANNNPINMADPTGLMTADGGGGGGGGNGGGGILGVVIALVVAIVVAVIVAAIYATSSGSDGSSGSSGQGSGSNDSGPSVPDRSTYNLKKELESLFSTLNSAGNNFLTAFMKPAFEWMTKNYAHNGKILRNSKHSPEPKKSRVERADRYEKSSRYFSKLARILGPLGVVITGGDQASKDIPWYEKAANTTLIVGSGAVVTTILSPLCVGIITCSITIGAGTGTSLGVEKLVNDNPGWTNEVYESYASGEVFEETGKGFVDSLKCFGGSLLYKMSGC